MKRSAEVITLSDSDDEAGGEAGSIHTSGGATASVVGEKPLSLSSLLPQMTRTRAAARAPHATAGQAKDAAATSPRTSVRKPNVAIEKLQKKGQTPPSLAKQPCLVPPSRTALTSSNAVDISTISLSHKEADLNSYCYESYDPRAQSFEPQHFNSKFRCCLGNCRMVLSNNVSFMFHLWAHVAQFVQEDAPEYLRETHRFFRCPQCLLVFPSTYRLQVHYNNVHTSVPSPATCKICEMTVEKDRHWIIHGDYDAPFQCTKCRYRTSTRPNYIDHFVRFHSNTRTLLCPFCLVTFKIPKCKIRPVICEPGYARHFMYHQRGPMYRCEQCSLKFLHLNDKKDHRKEHTKSNPKWISKNLVDHTRLKGRNFWPEKNRRTCLECGENLDVLDHLNRLYSCAKCPYRTYCYAASQRHKRIGCTIRRGGITRERVVKSVITCMSCGRSSCDEQAILGHLIDCSKGRALVDHVQEDHEQLSETLEEVEVKIFAIREQETRKTGVDKSFLEKLRIPLQRISISAPISKAYMELRSAYRHSLRTRYRPPTSPLSDMLRSSSSSNTSSVS